LSAWLVCAQGPEFHPQHRNEEKKRKRNEICTPMFLAAVFAIAKINKE
jgi:hypothetical protein